MKKTWIWITIGIILALVVGGIIGIMAFPKTTYIDVPTDSGQYCYDTSQMLYSANGLSTIPTGNFGSNDCLNNNPGYSECYIVDVCPNCATHKISCVCR